jgi:hypothetical protein
MQYVGIDWRIGARRGTRWATAARSATRAWRRPTRTAGLVKLVLAVDPEALEGVWR